MTLEPLQRRLRVDTGFYGFLGAGQLEVIDFAFNVADSEGNRTPQTLRVIVNGVNDAPVAANDGASTDLGVPVTINVLGNDSTPETGENFTVITANPPIGGTLAVLGNTSVRYTPNAGFTGLDTFTYRIFDGTSFSNFATVCTSHLAANFWYARHMFYKMFLSFLPSKKVFARQKH